MNKKRALVITSISSPNKAMKSFAEGALETGTDFWVIGDQRSPKEFNLEGCRFVSLEKQLKCGFSFGINCPTGHYSRKNIGYILAMQAGAEVIIDTDDDNLPYESFWNKREALVQAACIKTAGWCNIYRYFTNKMIWPRGLPLEHIKDMPARLEDLPVESIYCPIQQGLANSNPDVDAIFRLAFDLPFDFDNPDLEIILGGSAWCPFNSQNTQWFKPAFPLLYLPSYCSFRMTDIWRSFVAKRICAENNWGVLFHGSTVWQERNDHDLIKDFSDELPGYTNNSKIAKTLENLDLKSGVESIPENMKKCYSVLCRNNFIQDKELVLLDSWLQDIDSTTS
jgi:hypothetical protein